MLMVLDWESIYRGFGGRYPSQVLMQLACGNLISLTRIPNLTWEPSLEGQSAGFKRLFLAGSVMESLNVTAETGLSDDVALPDHQGV